MSRFPASLVSWLKPALGGMTALAALSLSHGKAKALLIYNIYESGGNVVVQTNGSLDLTNAISSSTGSCGVDGALSSARALICTGPGIFVGNGDRHQSYLISGGPSSFNGSVSSLASSVSGITTMLEEGQKFGISPSYISGAPIVSSATFNSTTLSGLGFTQSSGLLGTYSLDGTSETIQVVLGAPAVPGPLPLFGAGAAFGWSRRLRRRVQKGASTLPRA